MSVDLGELIDPLKREVNPPGVNLFPDATDDRWLGDLTDAFWEATLQRAIRGYTVNDDGIVTPLTGAVDLPRAVQQLIVLFAGYRIVLNEQRNTNSSFKAQAGPVSFEQQKSANLLQAVVKGIQGRIQLALAAVAEQQLVGVVDVAVFDAVIDNIYYGYWVR